MDYVLLTPATHPLASKRKLVARDLDGVELIGLAERATSRTQLDRALARRGVQLDPQMTVYDWDSARTWVELGRAAPSYRVGTRKSR